MPNTDHVEWLKSGHGAWNERRRLVEFSPDLSNVNFHEVLESTQTDRKGSDFFRRFNFSTADLTNADLSELDFTGAKFVGADLSGADLSSGIFTRARFDRATLHGTVARDAVFTRASFKAVDLRQANIAGAEFLLANLATSQLTDGQLSAVTETQPNQELLPYFEGAIDRGRILYQEAIRLGGAPEKEPTYLVLYATNRKMIPSSSGEPRFGADRDVGVNLGAAQVFVPKSHQIGSVGKPFWKRMFAGSDQLKIRKITPLNGQLHWSMVRNNFLRSLEISPATIFIHGYNTSFEDAVLWAAQIGSDLGLKKGVNLFSWPSQGAVVDYAADEAAVEASKYHLAQYLVDYIDQSDGPNVNIVAHSMGCRCLTGALEIIGLRAPQKLEGINNIVFAAADVDQDVMRNVGEFVIANAGLTTSYVCGKDVALSASGWLHKFARVGLLPPAFVLGDIDTIEVGKAKLLDLGHGYVADARNILSDMFQIICHSIPPGRRFALEEVKDGSGYWRIKE